MGKFNADVTNVMVVPEHAEGIDWRFMDSMLISETARRMLESNITFLPF